jgi:hypothetical protein
MFAEREDERVDDGALEEPVPGQPDVVLEPHEDRRQADQLVGHREVDRVHERIGDERQDRQGDGHDEQIAHPVVGPEDALEPDRPTVERGLGTDLGRRDGHRDRPDQPRLRMR